jgi:uncharacterized surface protein with fasciclin (FAS1) repeats
MNKKAIKPLAAIAFVAFSMAGCASSDTNDTTAMDATMTDTQTMAGTTASETPVAYSYDIIIMPDPSDTFDKIFSNTTDPVGYNDMFEDIDETENYDALALMRKNPNLSTFVRLLEVTNLEDDLQRVDGFTIFAPTNQAFAKIPKAKLEMLLMPSSKAALSRLLQAHVIPSKVYASSLTSNHIIELGPERHIPINVDAPGNVITVGSSKILMPNVKSKNALIHVVDNVIVPSEDAVQDQFGIY